MADNNSSKHNASNFGFKPIKSNTDFKPSRKRTSVSYKQVKVHPASNNEEMVAPKAVYPQVTMHDRWNSDCVG
jgi:hypothetical protein